MPARNSSMELSSPINNEVGADSEPGRRRSGRATRAPQYLSPAVPSTKRKRAAVAEEDMHDMSDEATEDGDSDHSEELPEKRRRKANNAKATARPKPNHAKANGIVGVALPVRPAAAKPKKAKKGARLTDAAAGGLYAQIFAAEDTLDDVAAQWLNRFGEHQANALTEVVNLLLRSSGCRIQVTVYDIEDPDNAPNKLTEIQDEYQAQNITDYPLIAKNKSAATFKKTLTGFFDSLIKSIAASNLLYSDPDLIENIQVWVACLSSAANRPFRHTATIVAFSIISALCEVAKGLVNAQAKLLRQIEGENKRSKANKKRIEDLQAQAKQSSDAADQLNSVIKDWYDTIFVHRYRDIIPAIRIDSVIYLTDWIMTHTDEFFDGAHLRYLGWLLADEDKSVRLEVVKQLHRIYNDETKIAGVQQFTERFRPRMVEMASRDKETNVRASAIELLETLRDAGLLEPDDIDTIGRLIYDAEPNVRKAVVPFVVSSIEEIVTSKVDDLGGQEALDDGLPSPSDGPSQRPSSEWLTFKTLAELLQSFDPEGETSSRARSDSKDILVAAPTQVESRFSFATQSIFQKFPDLNKWEVLAGYLLFDHSQISTRSGGDDFESQFKAACKLSEKEEIILLDVLNTSVKLSLAEVVEDVREKTNKKSKKEAQELLAMHETAAQRLAAIIPKLLNKFGAAPDAASAVLRLERMLNLDVFQDLRQDSTAFAALLDDVKKQFMSHDSSTVLAQASAALNHAKSFDGLGEMTAERMQALWDESTSALLLHCRGEELTERGGMDANVLASISTTMLRISTLARVCNCVEALEQPKKVTQPKAQRKQQKVSPVAPLDVVAQLLSRGRPGPHIDTEINEVEDTLVLSVIQSLLYYFLWQVHALQAPQRPSAASVNESSLSALSERRDAVSSMLQLIISERHGADAVRVAAAELLLDIHAIFVDRIAESQSPGMKLLADAELSAAQQLDILKVLTAAEKEFATKSKRKLEGPGEDDEPEDLSDDEQDDDNSSTGSADDDMQEDDDPTAHKRRDRAAQKQKELLVAEYKLCEIAAKIVRAILAGVVDRAPLGAPADYEGPVRRRLVKNRSRLGPNFKGVIEALERSGLAKDGAIAGHTRGAKDKKKGGAQQQAGSAKKAKSSRFVGALDDESDGDADVRMGDEIEDDEAGPEDDDLEEHERIEDGRESSAAVESVLGD